MRTNLVLLALALGLAWGMPARAEPVYSYRFDQAEYLVAPGGTIAVSVYLRETVGPNDAAVLASEGLFAAGVGLQWNDAALVQVASTLDIQANPAFTAPPLASVASGGAGLLQMLDMADLDGVIGTGGPDVFDLWLGTFTFTAGVTPGETLVRAGDLSTGDETLSNFGQVLDTLIAEDEARITVTGPGTSNSPAAETPEPTTLTLAALGATALLVARRSRRFRGGRGHTPDHEISARRRTAP